ncbi:hypothetical protein HJG60_011980 [Phyllostomus discolor]|uniref:Uncharacterized protein n=1 Tax=Phyllostomus discolor TaxID=89673 RepID=A0A834DW64_9CHIR|nr:hypothetical protein HJG60_011980 [Phyllostomus discolor]
MKHKTACFCPQTSETPGILNSKVESTFELSLKAELLQNRVFQTYPAEIKDERDEQGKQPLRTEKRSEHHYHWWQMFTFKCGFGTPLQEPKARLFLGQLPSLERSCAGCTCPQQSAALPSTLPSLQQAPQAFTHTVLSRKGCGTPEAPRWL